MFVILSIIFVICVILLIIRNTTKYADNFVRVDLNHILNLLFTYNFYKTIF